MLKSLVMFGVALLFLVPAGAAGQSLNVTQVGNLANYTYHSDIWGYAADTTEIAIVGTFTGTTFIDATDPANPVEVAFIPGAASQWRDIKTYRDHAYIVNETSGGLQIVDLSDPLNPTLAGADSVFFNTAHNVYADTSAALLLVAGTDAPGMLIFDVSTPASPVLVGNYTTKYVHDVFAENGIAYCGAIFDGEIVLVDISALPATPELDSATTAGAFCHNAWTTADGNFCLTTDEISGGHIQVFDVSDSTAIFPVAEWLQPDDPASIVHNAHVLGDLAYVSWYRTGFQILNVEDPYFPQRVGHYDTFAGTGTGFDGAWGVYPFSPSGVIYVSDIDTGFYTFTFDPDFGTVAGFVTDAADSSALSGATVTVVGENNTVTSLADGRYGLSLAPGSYTLITQAFGYEPDTTAIVVVRDAETVQDIALTALPQGTIRGFVGEIGQYTPVEGILLSLSGTPLTATTDSAGHYLITGVPPSGYTLDMNEFGYAPQSLPITMAPGQDLVQDIALLPSVFLDDLEATAGWVDSIAGDNASTGTWELADPVGTGGGLVQPEDDHTPAPGVLCFVTGASGGSIGANDVDGGITTLLSPIFDATGVSQPVLRYHRWYVNDAGSNPGQDIFTVDISNNGGVSWTNLEATNVSNGAWEAFTFPITSPTSQMQLRFIARDTGGGSIVEAAVDDIDVYGSAPTLSVGDGPVLPARLLAASPNPLRSSATIRFSLEARQPVRLDVFDLQGRRVRNLKRELLPAGEYEVTWDGRGTDGREVASGVYFLRLLGGGPPLQQKIIVAR